MSHIVQIQTQVRDPVAIAAACQRLTLPAPAQRMAKLYDGQYTGWCVELPGWRYPVVCNTASGELQYDNFQGHWGSNKNSRNSFRVMPWKKQNSKLVARGTQSSNSRSVMARSS